MPSLIDLRRKIRGVKSTRRVTNAMKIVSATKVRRAQEALFNLRPYAWRMRDVLKSLASRVDIARHPLLRVPERLDRVDIIVVTADKGLCGAFNQNIIREVQQFIQSLAPARVRLHCVGRKAVEFFRRREIPIVRAHTDLFRRLDYRVAEDIADTIMNEFIEGGLDAVFVVYNEYKSALIQKVVIERLLPLERMEYSPVEPPVDYIYEPEPGAIIKRLLPRHFHTQIYRILLESTAAEHSARMVAMDAATKNADQVIHDLTLLLNKTRQAMITKEILEVVNAAEALAGS